MTEQQLIGAAIPVFLLTIAAEVVLLRRKRFSDKAGYELKDALASLAMGSGFLVISGVFKLALIPAYLWLHQFRLFDIQNVWWSWLLLFVLQAALGDHQHALVPDLGGPTGDGCLVNASMPQF